MDYCHRLCRLDRCPRPQRRRSASFTPAGLNAVLAIACTALVHALQWIGSADGLLGTAYGRIALAKLGMFLLLLMLAGVNRFVLAERLRDLTRPLPRGRLSATVLWRPRSARSSFWLPRFSLPARPRRIRPWLGAGSGIKIDFRHRRRGIEMRGDIFGPVQQTQERDHEDHASCCSSSVQSWCRFGLRRRR